MRTRVATLMWGSAWERYGYIFAETFTRYWPKDVELVVVTDRELPIPRSRQIILQTLPGYVSFKEKWGFERKANGYDAPAGVKINEAGYSWRHDAVKWMPQGLTPHAAMEGLSDGDALIWFDADVETMAPIPRGWADTLLGGADVACLQRPGIHSEIGFHAQRVGPKTREFVAKFADFYVSGDVFALKESHSAFVFDRALEAVQGLRVRSLNEDGGKGHVFSRAPLLKDRCAHWKGKRKDRRAAAA